MTKVIKHPHFSNDEFSLPEHKKQEEQQTVMPDQFEVVETLPEPDTTCTPEELMEIKLKEARIEGYNQGFTEGQDSSKKQFEQELESVHRAVDEVDDAIKSFYHRLETRMLDVILAMVQKIVGVNQEYHPEMIQHSIRKVLARTDEPGTILTLRLHPDDYKRISPNRDTLPTNLRMLPDGAIQKGGCMLETQFGFIDARLETQLEELETTLREHLSSGSIPPKAVEIVENSDELRAEGRVVNVVGTVIESRGPNVTVGEQCEIIGSTSKKRTRAEVIGFKENRVLLMPLGEKHGIGPGSRVIAHGNPFTVHVGEHLLGRVLNGVGEPIDNMGSVYGGEAVSIHAQPVNAMQRRHITEPLYTGVRAIDGLLTCGKGGRMGVFAGSGVGKSTLLGMMARNTSADINVIALIGERGREVREFIENDLGEEGLKRSVVIAVTSDESPVLRIHGAKLAASVAEFFSKQGKNVMFMMDSVTRFAMAQREVGLAVGEPPTTKGYTPSTFAELPKLLERSGNFGAEGSITGFYTVLVEGDDMDEPVADHVRSILDGHIVLSRALFSQNHFPAIDVLPSISRLSKAVATDEHTAWAGLVRDNMATFQEAQDLVNIGAYVKGSNAKIDKAIDVIDPIKAFLKQGINEEVHADTMWNDMATIITKIKG